MLLRRLHLLTPRLHRLSYPNNNHTWTRCLSTSKQNHDDDLVQLELSEENEQTIAILKLNRPPVNSLSLELCQAISSSIKRVETEYPHIQGCVLKSTNPSTFCAGLDLMELYQPTEERLPQFWNSVQQVYLDLYGSRLAVIAALEGHAPAAGCMLALCCDYRIMSSSSKSTIGFNETQLGIVAPPFMSELMVQTVGYREAEKGLSLGHLYSPEEALNVGLVDETTDKNDVVSRAIQVAWKWSRIPSQARMANKQMLRQPHLNRLLQTRDSDTHNFCSLVQSKSVQSNLTHYLSSLKQQSKKKY